MASSVPLPGQPVRGSRTGRPVMALFDLLGRAWAMGVVWQLHDGPFTFRQLQDRCDGISPTLLNRRLKELRATALAEHGDGGYRLTALGDALFELIEPLGLWAKDWAAAIPGGADGSAIETVEQLADALDSDDFERVEACLHPDVVYRIGDATHHGPAEVVASYRSGSELARRLFDQVDFDHSVVPPTDGPAIRVDFSDLLQVRGEYFEHHSVQDITVSPDGRIITIIDQPIAGQRERLDAFMDQHGLHRL